MEKSNQLVLKDIRFYISFVLQNRRNRCSWQKLRYKQFGFYRLESRKKDPHKQNPQTIKQRDARYANHKIKIKKQLKTQQQNYIKAAIVPEGSTDEQEKRITIISFVSQNRRNRCLWQIVKDTRLHEQNLQT